MLSFRDMVRQFSRLVPFAVALVFCAMLNAQSTSQSASSGPYAATPQRPTFTADTSTTAPGTVELEFGGTATSSFGGFLALPTTVKFTPDVTGGVFRHAEFSLGFDSLTSTATAGGRDTNFGQTLSFVVRRPIYVGKAFSLAVAPRGIFYLRGDRGARVGARMLAAYGWGRSSVVGNFTWTSATSPSPTNPAQQYDVAFTYGLSLGESGWRERTALFAGFQVEKPKHFDSALSFDQGLSYRIRPNYVVDFAIQQRGIAAGARGYELLFGLTANLGHVK